MNYCVSCGGFGKHRRGCPLPPPTDKAPKPPAPVAVQCACGLPESLKKLTDTHGAAQCVLDDGENQPLVIKPGDLSI